MASYFPFSLIWVERLLGTGTSPLVSRHMGLLTAIYALALFLAAPAWGRLSDAHGRRNALLSGLLGFSGATAVFSLVESVAAIYVQRFPSGMFAAAAMPVAWATIGDLAPPDERRGRHVAVGLLLSLTLPHALASEVFGPQPHRKDTP